jgi:nucleotide-binding universal stress UspA family protein
VIDGDAAREIAEVAWLERIDLIVMATHGRTGLARLVLGSVATRTLQTAGVPVLLVRPPHVARTAEVAFADDAVSVPPVPVWLGG